MNAPALAAAAWLLVIFSAANAAEKKVPAAVVYEAIAATNATVWLAEDLKLFDRYGLDMKVIQARGAASVQALVAGTVEFGTFGGPSAVAANLAGADLVFLAAKPNYSVISLWTRKDSPLKTLGDLKGKTLAVSRPGSATHTAARLALRRGGLTDKDVKFLYHGGLPEMFASLEQGLADAAFSSPPRPGFREMIDLAALKIPYLQGAVEVQRGLLQTRRPLVVNFMKAFLESLKAAKDQPELAVAAIAKRMRMQPEEIRAAYAPHERVWEAVPYVRADAVQAILDLTPGEKNPERFIDNGVLKELEDAGFVRELYNRR
jgi:ABC-type nitrate/sulfonate/bicarbonate transport system substrate-binding protein